MPNTPTPTPSEPHHAGHRQRLRARFQKSKGYDLADYELIELLLFAAMPRRDVKPIAKALLKRFGSFERQQLSVAVAVELIGGEAGLFFHNGSFLRRELTLLL